MPKLPGRIILFQNEKELCLRLRNRLETIGQLNVPQCHSMELRISSNILWCFEVFISRLNFKIHIVKANASSLKPNHVLLLCELKLEVVSDAFNYTTDALAAKQFI